MLGGVTHIGSYAASRDKYIPGEVGAVAGTLI
jgi:hypothetical protein